MCLRGGIAVGFSRTVGVSTVTTKTGDRPHVCAGAGYLANPGRGAGRGSGPNPTDSHK